MQIVDEWLELSIWRKSLIGLLTLIWIGFTGAVVSAVVSPWYAVFVAVGGVWFAYIVVTYIFAKWN